jgi:hypothetical protein
MTDAYGELSLQSERSSLVARPESAAEVAFCVLRGNALAGPVKLEPIVPPHVKEIQDDVGSIVRD